MKKNQNQSQSQKQSQTQNTRSSRRLLKTLLPSLGFCMGALALNVAGALLCWHFQLPLYLDSVGTILAAAAGGYAPGILVGYLTNFLTGLITDSSLYYGVLNVLIAVYAAYFAEKGLLKKPWGAVLAALGFAAIGGGLGAVLTWLISEFQFGDEATMPLAVWAQETFSLGGLHAQVIAGFVVDLGDKILCVALALLLLRLLRPLIRRLDFGFWLQRPLDSEELFAIRRTHSRGLSPVPKIVLVISAAMLVVAAVTCSIAYIQFHDANISSQSKMGTGVANVAVSLVDGDRVEEYLTLGEAAEGYTETEERLTDVLRSSPDIEYVYVYQILPDGCHVVFDLDTPDTPGAEPGELIDFDESFRPLLPALLAGEEINPIVSNDSFGWLLTVYKPVYDSAGRCVCYAGVDISIHRMRITEFSFVVKEMSLFIGFFAMILAVALWLAEYGVILPINAIGRQLRFQERGGPAGQRPQFLFPGYPHRRRDRKPLSGLYEDHR